MIPITVPARLMSPVLLVSQDPAPQQSQDEARYKAIDAKLSKIVSVADTWPPTFGKKVNKEAILQVWRELEQELMRMGKGVRPDYMIEVRLGELYRLGHNLDVKDAWPKAVDHLKTAAKLDPEQPMPHVLLGLHYTFSGKYALGIEALQIALKLCGEEPESSIYFGLAHDYYFLERYREAIENADKYLKFYPNNKAILVIKERSEDVLRGGLKPKTIEIPYKQ